jgi:hypothetical protein
MTSSAVVPGFFLAFAASLVSTDGQSRVGTFRVAEWQLRELATSTPVPEYPASSLASKVSGVVVAAAAFGSDGRPHTIEILESPDAHTAAAAREAVSRWTVPGAHITGKVTFYFQVRNGKGVVLAPEQMPGASPPPRRPAPPPTTTWPPSAPIASPEAAAPAVRGAHGEDLQTVAVDVFKKEPGRAHIVLDIGERDAFRRGHWPGAVNIPLDELAVRGGIELPRDRRIVIDCTQDDIFLCRLGGGRLVEQEFTSIVLLVR